MVSLQSSHSQQKRKFSPNFENYSSKKRNLQEGTDENKKEDFQEFIKQPKFWKKEQANHIELSIDSPLPLEWQRCLDIKSGQIHYYNTTTHKRTCKDPRSSPNIPTLDLDLNLNVNFFDNDDQEKTRHTSIEKDSDLKCKNANDYTKSSSEISLDTEQKEMLAAVCMKCHMLVMMCKSSLSCPNCKFVHPQVVYNNKPNFDFTLLCCKD